MPLEPQTNRRFLGFVSEPLLSQPCVLIFVAIATARPRRSLGFMGELTARHDARGKPELRLKY